jgi:hypothetical protein
VELPKGAEPLDERVGDGDLAILAALGSDDADDSARGVDVAGLEADDLAEAQAAVIHEDEDGEETSLADRAEEAGDFIPAQDIGQLFDAANLDLAPALPLAAEVVAVEGAQGADGLIDGGVLQLPLLAQGNEEVEDLVLAELRGITLRVGLVELAHPVEVAGAGSWREATEIDTAFEVAPPLLRLKPGGLGSTDGTGGGLRWLCCFFFISAPRKDRLRSSATIGSGRVGAAKRLRPTKRG